MGEPTAAEVLRAFDRRAKRLESLTTEGLKLRRAGRITVGSLDALFESALLNLYTAFELFIEDLFYAALLGHSGLPDVEGKVVFSSRAQAEHILVGSRDYIKWLRYEEGVRPLADRLLQEGRPFDRLDRRDAELEILNEIRIVRNAIAHDSAQARARVEPLTSGLRPRRRHPAGYLQDVQQGVTQQLRYSTWVRQIATALAGHDDVVARNSLRPERPYQAKANVPKGVYECTLCRTQLRVRRSKERLPKCSTCTGARTKGNRGWQRIYV